jgi:D-alanine-D-alanine ligase
LAAESDRDILIEPFIPGRELTVALLDGKALPVVEIIPKSGFYDYHAKYTAGATDYICPAQLSQQKEQEVQHYAEICHRAVGCEGYSRADFRMNPAGELFFLELNTLPGMTATSLVPKAALAAGIEFPSLVGQIVDLGIRRFQQAHSQTRKHR